MIRNGEAGLPCRPGWPTRWRGRDWSDIVAQQKTMFFAGGRRPMKEAHVPSAKTRLLQGT